MIYPQVWGVCRIHPLLGRGRKKHLLESSFALPSETLAFGGGHVTNPKGDYIVTPTTETWPTFEPPTSIVERLKRYVDTLCNTNLAPSWGGTLYTLCLW